MRIPLQDLEPGGTTFEGSVVLSELPLHGEEKVVVRESRLTGTARPGAWGVDLRARLSARLELACSRCLEPFESALDVAFALILVAAGNEPDPDGESGSVDPDAPDPALFFGVEGSHADLAAIAREQVYLNLPLKPVCTPGCRGLCPTCGVNRNRIECGCPRETPDPRLAPLLQFRRRTGGG